MAQPGEVGHQVAFGHLGQRDRLGVAAMAVGDELVEGHLGDPGGAQLPGLAARAATARRGWARCRGRAGARCRLAAGRRPAVAATSRRSSRAPPCPRRRRRRRSPSGSGARSRPRAARRRPPTCSPGRGRSRPGTLRRPAARPPPRRRRADAGRTPAAPEPSASGSTPVQRQERRPGSSACACADRRATSAMPEVPSQPSWMAAVTAIRVWLVQTLEVAFSRRMSCSRARSVVT